MGMAMEMRWLGAIGIGRSRFIGVLCLLRGFGSRPLLRECCRCSLALVCKVVYRIEQSV